VAGPWRITVDRYLDWVKRGFFEEKDRVILWEGQLVEKMTKGRAHVVVMLRIADALKPLVSGLGYVEQEAPIRLKHRDDTLPEPDLKVVRGRDIDYAAEPTADDVPLVVGVADSSLSPDRNEVLKKYAIEGVPVYWIANIRRCRIEVFTGPSGPAESPGYGPPALYGRGQAVPVVIDGNTVGEVAVASIFGEDDPWLQGGE
jgi:Uma2 family endonuclease